MSPYPGIKQGANGPGQDFKKIFVQDGKITNFDYQAALFNCASMEAITYGFSEVRQLNSAVRTARKFYQVAQGQHTLLCALSTADQEPCAA